MSSTPSGADDRPRPAMDVVRLITSIGSPLALATSLLFYFGWVRSQAEATAFGADLSVFAMSTQELVLRSVDGLFVPAMFLLLAALLGLRLHRAMLAEPRPRRRFDRLPLPSWMRTPRTVWVPRIAKVLELSWVALLLIAAVLLAVAGELGRVTLPLWIGIAILGPMYGIFLRRRVTADPTRTPRPVAAVAAMLLTLTLFLLTERFANLAGQARAQDIKDHLRERLPATTVSSVKSLHITAPGVTETKVAGDDGSFHYRYDGLHLLQRSGGKYFLVSDGWNDGKGKLVLLPDNDSVRLDFGH